MVQEGQYRDEEEMVQSWRVEISYIITNNERISTKNYLSKVLKNTEELEERIKEIDQDLETIKSNKKKLLSWEEKTIKLIKNTYLTAEEVLKSKDLGGQGGHYAILRKIREQIGFIDDWGKNIPQQKQKWEKQLELNIGLFRVIQNIRPGIQTSLSRIAELTQLNQDITHKLLKQILSDYPKIGEYHEYEQVFVKHGDEPVLLSPTKTDTQRIAFFCQLDSERHPASESAYECQRCGRRICRRCYIDCQSTGITACAYCQGELVKIQ